MPQHSLSSVRSPRLSKEKTKAGVFIGPQIRQLFRDPQFDLVRSDDEKTA
jgi:hypothetical protein